MSFFKFCSSFAPLICIPYLRRFLAMFIPQTFAEYIYRAKTSDHKYLSLFSVKTTQRICGAIILFQKIIISVEYDIYHPLTACFTPIFTLKRGVVEYLNVKKYWFYSQRKVVLKVRQVQVPESEDFKPSNYFKPHKPDYNPRPFYFQ